MTRHIESDEKSISVCIHDEDSCRESMKKPFSSNKNHAYNGSSKKEPAPLKEHIKRNVKEFLSRLSWTGSFRGRGGGAESLSASSNSEKFDEFEAKTTDPSSSDNSDDDDETSSYVSEVRDDVQFSTEPQLTAALFRSRVNPNAFGTGLAKTVRDLFWEIQKRECEMRWADGHLERHVRLMKIYLYFDSGKERKMLIEKAQQIGPRRRDLSSLHVPIVKNMYYGEHTDEENYQELMLHNLLGLPIEDQRTHLRFLRRVERVEGPYTEVEYPGLWTRATIIERYLKIKDPSQMATSSSNNTQIIGLPFTDDQGKVHPTRPFTFDEEAVPLWKRHFWSWADVHSRAHLGTADRDARETMIFFGSHPSGSSTGCPA